MDRTSRIDWAEVTAQLDAHGYAVTAPVVSAADCRELVAGFDDESRYRSVVDMSRHRFGSGVYKYFAAPLPPVVAELRERLYAGLAPIANEWAARLGGDEHFPPALGEFLDRCHAAGQSRPTPLVFRYGEGDHNRLHQDVYGDVRFPLQVVTALDRPDVDFTGGEFLLVTQPPRAQSLGEAIRTERGRLVIFPNARRPMTGARGWYGANVRHGVSPVRSGTRHTLGVIFHDAA